MEQILILKKKSNKFILKKSCFKSLKKINQTAKNRLILIKKILTLIIHQKKEFISKKLKITRKPNVSKPKTLPLCHTILFWVIFIFVFPEAGNFGGNFVPRPLVGKMILAAAAATTTPHYFFLFFNLKPIFSLNSPNLQKCLLVSK